MYEERESRLASAVLWRATGRRGPARVLPDGCIDLIWCDGELIVAGPDTHAHLGPGRPGAEYVGLRFAPGSGPGLLGVPAHELRDRRVPLAAVRSGAQVRRFTERIDGAADRGLALEEAARRLCPERPPSDPLCEAVVHYLGRGQSVSAAAAAAGIGERQLHRRCLAAFGYGPKTLARVLRFDGALRLARRGVPYAEVALLAGYADQAHLSREVRALAGLPLGQLVAGRGTRTVEPR
ncbi:helix-turn-helix domain-containing protein [Streptomyces meridianus]|uniref:Helix-turn-helix domain-containing protein n=1 Tax=Streptomyces meridianus TaxID=2938945 RepID=A0ABT0X0K9_9ACTN|nr:AraC family transcriptional regulator [Streptomyces meridianus]MCM2576101.1 helix-turn-helix domain-containing protein [Streptomyces meridianus]